MFIDQVRLEKKGLRIDSRWSGFNADPRVLKSLRLDPVAPLSVLTSCRWSCLVLHCSSYIKQRQTNLQKDQRVRPVVQAPRNPQDVAAQEKPEAPISFQLSL
jgi:hypothetical protein